jgi:hypothetical protein
MTAAFNLAQLANNLNSSGQLDATDGLTGLITNANLASSGTASSTTFLRGDRTWGTPPSASIATTGEAIAGTNNTNFITPLRMREGFNASGSAPVYAVRAWINFDGINIGVRASGNISSLTDNGVGDYTITFAQSMPTSNYVSSGMSAWYVNLAGNAVCSYEGNSTTGGTPILKTTSQARVAFGNSYTGGKEDPQLCCITFIC